MGRFDADKLALWAGGEWSQKPPSFPVSGFSNDTRLLQENNMFLALKTKVRDGHSFIAAAEQIGASSAMVTKASQVAIPQLVVDDVLQSFQNIAKEWRLVFPGKVVGITGSCGKTTTKDLLSLLLGKERTHATPKNLNNHLGVPLTLTGIDASKHEFAVVEAGINGPGEMNALASMIVPDIAIITMIGRAHLEGLEALNQVAYEKSILGKHVKEGGKVIYPASCCEYERFAHFSKRGVVLVPDDVDVLCEDPEQILPYESLEDANCMVLKMWRTSEKASLFKVPKWSPGMMSNAALAITAASILGISDENIQSRIKEWRPSHLRGEVIRTLDQAYFVDCYNANPDAYADAFIGFRLQDIKYPRYYALGCMNELGDSAERLHYETGIQLKIRSQDRVGIIGDHADAFKQGIMDAGAREAQIKVFNSLEDMRKEVSAFFGYIMVKGSRSYQMEQLLPEGNESGEVVAC